MTLSCRFGFIIIIINFLHQLSSVCCLVNWRWPVMIKGFPATPIGILTSPHTPQITLLHYCQEWISTNKQKWTISVTPQSGSFEDLSMFWFSVQLNLQFADCIIFISFFSATKFRSAANLSNFNNVLTLYWSL